MEEVTFESLKKALGECSKIFVYIFHLAWLYLRMILLLLKPV